MPACKKPATGRRDEAGAEVEILKEAATSKHKPIPMQRLWALLRWRHHTDQRASSGWHQVPQGVHKHVVFNPQQADMGEAAKRSPVQPQ